MKIAAIIPSHGLADKLYKSLMNLFWSKTRHELYACVIDNGTPDESVYDVYREFKKQYPDSLIYVQLPWNASFARASNTGIHVTGQVDAFLFLNNDCYVGDDCVDQLAKSLAKGDGDIIGARLLYPDNTIQHAGGAIRGKWEGVFHLNRGCCGFDPKVLESRRVHWVTAACMMVRAHPFVRVGGFMEVFQNGYEDVDLCLRFWEKKWTVYYNADAVGTHEEAQTLGRKDHESENARMFFNKWKNQPIPIID